MKSIGPRVLTCNVVTSLLQILTSDITFQLVSNLALYQPMYDLHSMMHFPFPHHLSIQEVLLMIILEQQCIGSGAFRGLALKAQVDA